MKAALLVKSGGDGVDAVDAVDALDERHVLAGPHGIFHSLADNGGCAAAWNPLLHVSGQIMILMGIWIY